MPPPLGPDFPAAAVRDALGLTRLLFALERDGTDSTRAAQLTEIGRRLNMALSMRACGRDSMGYRAAVTHSEEAVDALAAMEWPADVAELVRVCAARVRGQQPRKLDAREQKKAATIGRG